jgi:hypothetical protein
MVADPKVHVCNRGHDGGLHMPDTQPILDKFTIANTRRPLGVMMQTVAFPFLTNAAPIGTRHTQWGYTDGYMTYGTPRGQHH